MYTMRNRFFHYVPKFTLFSYVNAVFLARACFLFYLLKAKLLLFFIEIIKKIYQNSRLLLAGEIVLPLAC